MNLKLKIASHPKHVATLRCETYCSKFDLISVLINTSCRLSITSLFLISSEVWSDLVMYSEILHYHFYRFCWSWSFLGAVSTARGKDHILNIHCDI